MARKRPSDEDIVKLLREIEVRLASGSDVSTACRAAGISDGTYYTWRKKFGGMARSQLSEIKALEKENQGLKKIVADLCRRINLNAQVIAPHLGWNEVNVRRGDERAEPLRTAPGQPITPPLRIERLTLRRGRPQELGHAQRGGVVDQFLRRPRGLP